MMQEPEIKRWTAKRKAELIRQVYKGQTSIEKAAREDVPVRQTPLQAEFGRRN